MRCVAFVFDTMGTTVSLATGEPLAPELATAVREVFADYEAQFSLYRADTEASEIARGELELAAASPRMQQTYALAQDWERLTLGAFTPHRSDGVIDLAGVVKALAIAAAGDVLNAGQLHNWCLNAGGDVLTSGKGPSGAGWLVGIVDPDDSQVLLSQFCCSTAFPALATSGTTERGEHIWRLPAESGARRIRQVSVVASDIVTADVLATAVLAGGEATLELAVAAWPIELLASFTDGSLAATASFRSGG